MRALTAVLTLLIAVHQSPTEALATNTGAGGNKLLNERIANITAAAIQAKTRAKTQAKSQARDGREFEPEHVDVNAKQRDAQQAAYAPQQARAEQLGLHPEGPEPPPHQQPSATQPTGESALNLDRQKQQLQHQQAPPSFDQAHLQGADALGVHRHNDETDDNGSTQPLGESYWEALPTAATAVAVPAQSSTSFSKQTAAATTTTAVARGDKRWLAGAHGAGFRGRRQDGGGVSVLATIETGHEEDVRSVAFSPDSSLLASTGSNERTVKLWRVSDRTLLATLCHSDDLRSVDFSPDSSLLASGSRDNTVTLWQVPDKTLLHEVTCRSTVQVTVPVATLTGHLDGLSTAAAFSPDSSLLATGSYDRTVKLWRVPDDGGAYDDGYYYYGSNDDSLATLTGHLSYVSSVAFSPDSSLLASGSADATVKLWKVSDRTLLATLNGHSFGVIAVAFSPDSSLLASGSADETVKLWKVSDRTLVATLSGHSGNVYSVAFSPDSSLLASGSADETVKLWKVSDRTLVATLTHSSHVYSVAFSPDSSLLASGSADSTVKLWSPGCQENACSNQGNCTINEFKNELDVQCNCNAGFSGTNCQNNINECAGQTCSNHGSCSDGVNSYWCTCDAGFSGTNCESNINECAGQTCSNHGSCSDGVNSYSCTCDAGFSGTNCESNINECAGQTCSNHGSCSDGVNSYSCTCKPGYSGTNCQTNINDCAGQSCSNHGSCIDGINKYTCNCNPGYTGIDCGTEINECQGVTCSNRGSCIDGINKYTCSCDGGYSGTDCESNCDAGFTGTNCQTNINDCAGQTCSNHGSCIDGIAKYTCECDAKYTGSTCQYSNAETCNNVGIAQVDGRCVGCNDPSTGIGSNCQYSNAKNCNSAGTVDISGKCTCNGPETGVGPTCSEYTNAKTCNSAGIVDSTGKCKCNDPAVGEGPTCSEYTNNNTCNSLGVVDFSGKCTCDDPAVGEGPTCSEYTNTKTCLDLAIAQIDGTCKGCTNPELGVGPNCEFNNDKTCNGVGTVDSSGKCTCAGPETGLGPTCSEYTNNKTCLDLGIAQPDGTCKGCDNPELGVGPTCEFNNDKTCNGAGVVNSAGECTCDNPELGVGPNCEFNNAKTCNNLGTAFADGRCFCDDPSMGAGLNCDCTTECDFNREKTCNNHGNATSTTTSSCDCDFGYAGDNCEACNEQMHTRFPPTGTPFTCEPNDGLAKCNPGQFSQDNACKSCPDRTFANGKREADESSDGGYRIKCRPCPDGETSRQDGTGCFQTYQISTLPFALFCSGRGSDVSKSALSRIDAVVKDGILLTAVQACSAAADALNKTFLDPSAFAESAPCHADHDQVSLADCVNAKNFCAEDNRVEISGVLGLARDTCRFTCGTCWNVDAKGSTPFPFGCVLDNATSTVTYYSEEDALKYYNGDPYTPVCERRTCPGEANVPVPVTENELKLDSKKKPICKRSEQELLDLAAAESAANNKLFFPIAIPLVVAMMLIALCIAGDCSEGRQTAKFVLLGVGLRAFDFMTDWATYAININGKVFAAKFGDGDVETEDANVDLVRLLCLIFCIVGSVLTPYDIWGALQRKNKRYPAAMAIGIAILFFEDFPQLSINMIYISAVGADPLAIISFVASVGGILYNVYVLVQDCRGGKKPSLRAMFGCAKKSNAARDEIEMEEMRRNTTEMEANPMHAAPAAVAMKTRQLAHEKERAAADANARAIAEQGQREALSEIERLKAEMAEMKREANNGKRKGQQGKARFVHKTNIAGFAVADVGKPCIVRGIGSGTIRFVGLHAENKEPRVGVEMNRATGKNNGTVKGHAYFQCKSGHGLLTHPSKVKITSRAQGKQRVLHDHSSASHEA